MVDEKQPGNPGNPGVIAGDRIYFNHPERGAVSGEVAAVGRHGVSVPHESGEGHIGVRWEAILGHQKRRERRLKVLEEGEDGYLAENEDGQRVFVRGSADQAADQDPAEAGDPDEGQDGDDDDQAPLNKALLLDVGPLSCDCTDHALEALHKALSEDGIQDWARHESPFIADLIERFSQEGLLRAQSVRDELSAWIAGERHINGLVRAAAPAAASGAWSETQLGLVRTYLQALPSSAFGLEDWALLVDYLAQRYMPESLLLAEAEMLVSRAGMMGYIEAHLETLPAGSATRILAAMPSTVAAAASTFAFSEAMVSILDYGRLRACDAVTGAAESLRLGLRRTILAHEQKRLAGDPSASNSSLQQQLFDQFGRFNRDWRMIAVTEAGEICNQGVIAAQPPGAMVRRMEQYHGACPFCSKLDGRVFRVTTASDPAKNGTRDVWPGKTNLGRSASPRRRSGTALVPRPAHERWWAAAGTQHPHCRGRWEPLRRLEPGQDPAFERWMMERAGVKFGLDPLGND